jgi:ankyrin repeat protein
MGITVSTPAPNSMEFLWPRNLPWFQFHLPGLISVPLDDIPVEFRSSSAVGAISLLEAGASSVQLSQSPSQLAAVVGCIMPEAHQGENLARAVALITGPVDDRLQESLKCLVYQYSNNSSSDEMYDTFSGLFKTIGLARMPLLDDLAGSSHTVRAFATNLFNNVLNRVTNGWRDEDVVGLDVLEWLVRNGMDPDTKRIDIPWRFYEDDNDEEDKDGEYHQEHEEDEGIYGYGYIEVTPMQAAIFWARPLLIRRLIDLGADVNLTTEYSRRKPLSLALRFRNRSGDSGMEETEEIVHLLLNAGAGRSPEELSVPLNLAIRKGLIRVVKLLQRHGADFEFRLERGSWFLFWDTALSSAARHSLDFFKEILGQLPFQTQCRIRAGLSSLTNGALSAAIFFRRTDIIQYLLDLGVDLGNTRLEGGISPIQLAILSSSVRSSLLDTVSLCRYLVQNGACLHQREKGSPSALQLAAMRGDVGLMEFLLQKGVSVQDCCTLDWNHRLLRCVPSKQLFYVLKDLETKDLRRLLITICRISAPSPVNIVVECLKLGYNRTPYALCGQLLQRQGHSGRWRFFTGYQWEMVDDALAQGVRPEDITIDDYPSLT